MPTSEDIVLVLLPCAVCHEGTWHILTIHEQLDCLECRKWGRHTTHPIKDTRLVLHTPKGGG